MDDAQAEAVVDNAEAVSNEAMKVLYNFADIEKVGGRFSERDLSWGMVYMALTILHRGLQGGAFTKDWLLETVEGMPGT